MLNAVLSACIFLGDGRESLLCGSKAVLGGFKEALGFGLGSGPLTGYREGYTAHSMDTENPAITARIARISENMPICRDFVRAILSVAIDRN